MNKAPLLLVSGVLGCALLSACPPPATGPGGGGGQSRINPEACGDLSTAPVSRRVHAFLVASAELDRASITLENTVLDSCRKMAGVLGISPLGDTRTVCSAVKAELDANLQVSVSTEKRLVTREVPGECHTEVDFAASVVAECEASVAANVDLTCNGRCGGTCNGTCNGTCAGSSGTGGACNGACDGTCAGSCTGRCDGYLTGGAEAECRAAVEVRSSVNTVCTPPRLEVVEESVVIVDDTKFRKAQAAIIAGLPSIRDASRKAEMIAKAGVTWTKTLGSLISSTGALLVELGERSVCVGGQLQAALAAATQVEARFSVSIEVSASISGSAGVQ
jgi:hypothetical protein